MAGPRAIVFLYLFSCVVLGSCTQMKFHGFKMYRLNYTTSDQIHDPDVTFWSKNDVMVSPRRQDSFLAQLQEREITWEVQNEDVQKELDEEKQSAEGADRTLSFHRFNRYDDIAAYVAWLAAHFPSTVSLQSLGTSLEGRLLPVVKVSTGGNGTRPVVLIAAGIHAREWIAPAMALYIIQQLVENPSNADLIAGVDWHIVPLLNPDGYEYSLDAWHSRRRIEKPNYKSTSCPLTDIKEPISLTSSLDGVNHCRSMLEGPRPYSVPETTAFRDYIITNAADIKLFISFRAFGENIFYPWAGMDAPVSETDLYELIAALNSNFGFSQHTLASKANAAQMAAGGNSYKIGPSSHVFCACVAGLEYSVELPGGGVSGFDLFPAAIARTVTTFWPAVRAFGEHVAGAAGAQ